LNASLLSLRAVTSRAAVTDWATNASALFDAARGVEVRVGDPAPLHALVFPFACDLRAVLRVTDGGSGVDVIAGF
jgi:hypothetical protein